MNGNGASRSPAGARNRSPQSRPRSTTGNPGSPLGERNGSGRFSAADFDGPQRLSRKTLQRLQETSKYDGRSSRRSAADSHSSRPKTSKSIKSDSKSRTAKDDHLSRMIARLNGELDEQNLEADRPLMVRMFYKLVLLPLLWTLATIFKWWKEGLLTLAMETIAGYWCMYSLPFQLAFQHPVMFDSLYVISYLVDGLALSSRAYPVCIYFMRIVYCSDSHIVPSHIGHGRWTMQTGVHGMHSGVAVQGLSNRRSSNKRGTSIVPSTANVANAAAAQNSAALRISADRARRRMRMRKVSCKLLMHALLRCFPFVPFDLFFWGTDVQWIVPYVRFTRLLYAPYMVHHFHTAVEASQLMSFTLSRYFRVLVVFAYASHWLGCFFFFVAERAEAIHYEKAPWVVPTEGTATKTRYLWSSYWSMMSLTTTGHVDVVNIDGREWEVSIAMVVVLFSTFCFTYMNANITSLIMRHTQTLDRYRLRLSQVDGYLTRNQVSKDVRRLVKRHFRMSLDDERLKDQALLDQMPHALRRQVLYDIHMRTMRRVPLFFGCEPMMLQHLCNVVKRVVVLPDTALCSQGDVMTEMYFLEAGMLSTYEDVVVEAGEEAEDERNEALQLLANLRARCRRSVAKSGVKKSREFDNLDEESKVKGDDADEVSSEAGSFEASDMGKSCTTDSTVSPQVRLAPTRARFNVAESTSEKSKKPGRANTDKDSKLVEMPGAPVAEAAFFFGVRQDVTVEAIRPSACLVLSKADYSNILRDFPDSAEKICYNVKVRLKSLERWEVLDAIEKTHGKSKEHIASLADLFNACATGNLAMAQNAVNQGGVSLAETDFEGRSCLHIAASSGQLGVVQWLLDSNVGINKVDAAGKTALESTLFFNHTEVVKLLRSKGAILGWEPAEEGYHLCDAIRQGHMMKLKLLIDCGVCVDSPTFDSRCALHHAAAEGNTKAAELLLCHDANVNARDRWGGTPMRDAVRGGHTKLAMLLKKAGGLLAYEEVEAAAELCEQAKNSNLHGVKVLLDCGANPNAADYDKRTALHLAASTGNMPIAQHLIKRNADVNATDRWGGTPLRDAVREGHKEVALMLRAFNGTLGFDEGQASSELCELARQGNTSNLEVLLKCGAEVNSADYDKRTCMHLAASEGNLPAVELLFARGANVNARDRWGGTPLRDAVREGHKNVAMELRAKGGELGFDDVQASGELCELARNGSLDLLKVMLACGAPVNAADYDQRTCLHLAASVGNTPIVTCLLEANADINAKDRWKGTPLVDAVRHGHMETATYLFTHGGELGFDDVQASGELCELARQGSLDLLKVLLRCGANVNAADYDKRTCLHLAASEGAFTVVGALLDASADVNFKDRWGGTPLRDAVRHGHSKCAQLLREHGGELAYDEVEASGELCELARQGALENLKILLQCGVHVNAADYDLRTCLHLAASEGSVKIVEVLAQAGADINFKDRWGGTPLRDAVRHGHVHVANVLRERGGELGFNDVQASGELCELARQGSLDLLKVLLKCGANVNAADYDQRTCIHLAASEGALSVIQVLIDARAEVNGKDRWGGTPLRDAMRHGHIKAAELLHGLGGELMFDEQEACDELCNLARKGNTDTIRLMITCGVNVNASDSDKRVCLHLAAAEGMQPIVDELISAGADVNAKDRWGNTPLMEAMRSGSTHVMNALIKAGGKLFMDPIESAFRMCSLAREGRSDPLVCLLECGIDANVADYDGRTPLHLAAVEGHKSVVAALIKWRAGTTKPDRWGNTPQSEAAKAGHNWDNAIWVG